MKKRTIVIIFVAIFLIGILFAKFSGLVVTSINTCYDTDGGKNYDVEGTVQGVYYLLVKEEYNEMDYCKNGQILIEHYCVSEDMHSYREKEEFFCELGCEQGKCIRSSLKELPTPPEPSPQQIQIPKEEVKGIIGRIRSWLGI